MPEVFLRQTTYEVKFGFSPENITFTKGNATENQADATLGTLSNDDFDGTTTTYSIADNSFFVLDGNVLKLKAGVSLDYETQNGTKLLVTAADGSGAGTSITREITINFGDVNEAPTTIDISNRSVAENSAGAVIGNLTTDDPEQATLTFNLSGTDAGLLEVDAATGDLKLKDSVSLNYEQKTKLNVTVSVTDGGATIDKNLVIDVTDVNDAPALAGDLTGSVTRGGTYTLTSADLSFTDEDDNASAMLFVVTEPRGGYVTVGGLRERTTFGTKEIDAGLVVFHHDGTSASPFFVVLVNDDSRGSSPSRSFVINVIEPPPPPVNSAPIVADDIADQVTQAGSSYSFQIPAGSFVDPDGNALTYSVGALPAWLSFNAQTQTFTGSPTTSDAGAVAVTVTASDGSLSVSDTFDMIVTNPGNPSNSIELSNREVAENSRKNTVIGEFSSSSDDGAPFTFELIRNPDHAFKIVGDELRVRKHADLDFETRAHYKIKVEMHDADGDTVRGTFRIKLTDVEESPKGTRHDDRLVGDALDNELDGRRGNDKLIGNGEADIFVLGKHYGRDAIIDFDPEEGDKIDLSDAVGIRGFSDLMRHHVTDIGDHVKITADDGSALVIKHFEPEDLAKDMFLF